ncbi:MAG TPA: PQQ-binding-like beta-propeller repeat protein [Vicinamibacteria bacterium]|nr:PQQ-binding-like beta-propeller repeat protein [Vicinamibacteria bacterium]
MTLEDHLRRATRNFTAPLPEDDVFALGALLARELARAHAESPPRHPDLEPSAVAMRDGAPRLPGGHAAGGGEAEDLFLLGALLAWLATTTRPEVSWRLDGVPAAGSSTLARRAALAGLGGPRRADRFASATEAAAALEAARQGDASTVAPWPVFRGDAGRSGARPSAPAASFEPRWHARLGAVLASPVVAPGAVLVPTADGRLVFLEPKGGRPLHELRLGSAVESTPALAGGLAFVGTDEGELVAVDAVAGEERYRLRLGQMIRSSPVALEGEARVLVGVVEGRTAGALAAIEGTKGKLLWTRKLGAVFSSPAVAGDRALVGSDDGSLHAVDLGRGSLAWSHRLGGKVRATPAVAGDLAVVADFAGLLVAVRVADGKRAWSRAIGHAVYSSACVAGGLCVVGCREGHIHGFDLASGEPRFETATRGPVVSSPVAAGAGFLVGSTDGGLYLIAADGRVLHRSELSAAGVQSSAALGVEPAVFVGSGEGLHALHLRP